MGQEDDVPRQENHRLSLQTAGKPWGVQWNEYILEGGVFVT